MFKLPENLNLLHEGEALIRARSVAVIENDADLQMHFVGVEQAMNLLQHFAVSHATEEQDLLVVQLLGIRLFRGAGAVVQLVLSAYYQNAALQVRDMLEVAFLLDYFDIDRARIEVWTRASDADRKKLFKPFKIREALDDRDGFEDRKRAKHYDLLSTMAGHPTPQGFRMLRPAEGGLASCGQIFVDLTFRAVAAELAQVILMAAEIFSRFFDEKTPADLLVGLGFYNAKADWARHFLGVSAPS